ncbi:MAG: response regulator [Acidobacteria bacterium]|nr:response regulator [Acidobacteriota bacterium]
MSEIGYNILLVEDEEEHARLIKRAFQKESPSDTITLVSSAREMWEFLKKQPQVDLFILDYSLPDTNGLNLLAELQIRKLDKPVIIITGYGDESIAVQTIKLGATDYLVKSPTFPQMLPAITHRAIRSYQLRRRFDEAQAHLHLQTLLLDNVHDAIIGTDMDNDIVYWNQAAERIFGWSAQEILGENITKIIPTALDKDEWQPQFDKLRLATQVIGEWLGVTAKKQEIWLSIHTRMIADAKGSNIGLLNVAQDITEQKRLQHQTNLQIKHTEVINLVLTNINATVELIELLPKITSLLKEVFECQEVWFDPASNFEFSQWRQKTIQNNSFLSLEKEMAKDFYLILKQYLLTQKSSLSILDENSFLDLSWKDFLEKHNLKSLALILLEPSSSSFWLIGLGSAKNKIWSTYEVGLLNELARIITLALEKALFYQKTHDAATYEQIINYISLTISQSLDIDQILVSVCQEIIKHLRVDRCVFFNMIKEEDEFFAFATYEKCSSDWPSIRGKKYRNNDYKTDFNCIWQGEPWIMDSLHILPNMGISSQEFIETNKVQSAIVMPIMNREDLVGAIALHQCSYLRDWTQGEIALVKAVARQCSIAINNAQLYGQSRKSEERYRSLFDNANDAIIIADKESRLIIDANSKAEKLLSQQRSDLLKLDLINLHPKDEYSKYLSAYQSLNKIGYLYLHDGELQQKNGDILPVELRASIINLGQGADSFIQAIFRDMTEQRKLEQQLFHSQRLESIGTLTGGIAHDFNNLLAGILGYAELFKKKLDPSNTKLYNYAGIIEQSATHGAELAQRLVAFARGGSPKSQILELNSIVEDTLKLLKRALGRSIEIKSFLDPNLYSIEANATQIQQILMNLCINARDAMPNGGLLSVSTANIQINKSKLIKGLKFGDYVLLSVSDNGSGMDESTLARIFEPFFTTKEIGKGTGLGLAMVATIVRETKGQVLVDTKLGQGTSFHIYLPSVAQNVAEVIVNDAKVFQGTETILVVDDEETLRYLAKDLLEAYGYKILLAADGLEALEIYRNKSNEIAVLLLDMVMPKMGGQELYRKILEINPKVKVVFASGYCPPEEIEAIWQEGLMGFVQKPYQIEGLTAELRKVLDRI